MSSTTKSDINDDVLRKLEKLFRLQRSSNEHEAATAATRAAELMLKYQIDMAQLRINGDIDDEDDPIIDEILRVNPTRNWHSKIAYGVAAGYGGHCYTSKHPNATILRFVGTADMANAARYTTTYLCDEVQRLAKAAFQQASDRHSFSIGAAIVIAQRMAEFRQTAEREAIESQALVVVRADSARIDAHFEKLNLKPSTVRSQYASQDAYAAGAQAGAKLQLRGGRELSAAAAQLKGD